LQSEKADDDFAHPILRSNFDFKICSAFFAPQILLVVFSNPSNSKGFELQWFGKIYIPHDIAPFLMVWGAEINVELALILETENLVNFQNSARIRQNSSRPAMGVGRLCLLLNWFTRAAVSVSSFDTTLFFVC